MDTPITRKDALKLGGAMGVALAAHGMLAPEAQAADVGVGSRPSVLLIIVDDMSDRWLSEMEQTRAALADQGTRFWKAQTAVPLCGPNRAAIFTGQFPHTTGVKDNSAYPDFLAGGHEAYTFVKALHDDGYDTGLFGKYMNGRANYMTTVPPGWDKWFEVEGSSQQTGGFDASEDGTIVSYDSTHNDSQVAHNKAEAWILNRNPGTTPFFCQYSPTNPHLPHTPIADHSHDGEPVRNAPSINEADVSDKPLKAQKGLKSTTVLQEKEEGYQEEVEDADNQVASLIDAAEQVTGNSNLLIIFTSDNGVLVGEHRLQNKSWPYQENVEIPLLIRGTGLPVQAVDEVVVSSVDIFNTVLRFAGTNNPRGVDGRSLHNIVLGNAVSGWRKRVVIEDEIDKAWLMYREYQDGVTGKNFVVIRHLDDTDEYYDLDADPYQLENDPGEITNDMNDKLDRLTTLHGSNLKAVEEEA